MFGAFNHDFSLGSLSDLRGRNLALEINCLLYETSGVLLNEHELNDVELLVLDPILVELLEYGLDFIDQLENSLVALLFAYALIRFLDVVQKLAEVIK